MKDRLIWAALSCPQLPLVPVGLEVGFLLFSLITADLTALR